MTKRTPESYAKPRKNKHYDSKFATLRMSKGMTQEQIANAIGVTITTIARWESGLRSPSIQAVRAIARAFNCTIDEVVNAILDDEEEAKNLSAEVE